MNFVMPADTSALDLGLTRQSLEDTFAPYVAREISSGEMDEWRAMIKGRGRKILKRRLHRQLLGWLSGAGRAPTDSAAIYEATWDRTTLDNLVNAKARAVPFVWGQRRMMAAAPGMKRVHLHYLMRVIERLRPRSVLEVGCGIGINLFVLGARFPDIAFQGIDLTANGIAAIQALSEDESLPAALLAYSPEPSRDPGAHRRIQVRRGSAAEMPYGDGEFDLIYSVQALEQMEAIRTSVMAELRRVSRSHVAMIEAFRDWNLTGMRRNYIVAQDFFAARTAELPRFGLHPVLITNDMPSKVNMAHGLVVAASDP